MTIVGFGFNKIEVEKIEGAKGKINISNNVSIKEVKETTLSVGKDKPPVLKFVFEFLSSYEPKVGKVLLGGDLTYMEEGAKIKEIQEKWKKDKKLPADIMSPILNTILAKANILALILSQEVNLPPPIPLPKLKAQEK
ncbi:MAG: hypothetical protein KJ601_03255 [Nanoarchaeota archaeon]|nr:hypothetical protein [Nanoarchaeota archaeon]MBU1704195.1 hypothetical protein [Nanoarchaeota archaeon]